MIPKTIAGRLEFIRQLLGGQPILDQYGEPTGEVTPSFITEEDAIELLNLVGEEEE